MTTAFRPCYSVGMEEEKRKPGRPPGTGTARYVKVRSVRLKPEDMADLEGLMEAWRTTEAETIRRAIREAAQRERRKGKGAE